MVSLEKVRIKSRSVELSRLDHERATYDRKIDIGICMRNEIILINVSKSYLNIFS